MTHYTSTKVELEESLRSELADTFLSALLGSDASRFPWKEIKAQEPLFDLLEERTSGWSQVDLVEWRAWLSLAVRDLTTALPNSPRSLASLVQAVIDRDLAQKILASSDVHLLERLASSQPDLCQSLLRLAPSEALDKVAALWGPIKDWNRAPLWQIRHLITSASEMFLDVLSIQIGYEAGLEIHKDRADPRDVHSIRSFWQQLGATGLPPSLVRQTMLWAAIRNLAAFEEKSWEHRTEIVGAQAWALKVAEEHPEEWARALPWLLARMHLLGGFIEATTLVLARDFEPVRSALREAGAHPSPGVRDRARGIEALLRGFSSPQESLAHQLLSLASRLVDGATAFPHPLEPMSSTWIGSLAVEQILRRTVEAGQRSFIPYFLDQGRIEEEAVTSRLLTELEFAFRGVSVKVAALGAGTGKAPPSIGFLHKQVPKKEEETYGCDLALLVRGRVPGALRVESAELVQVKKPESGEGGLGGSAGFRNSWRIDTKQLADILEWSETAAYWLIDGSGEVFVVPARLLRGILEERGKLSQGSAAVPYSGIRAMAIPLPEFLVDLVIGLWIGTARDTTLRLARGETGSTRPRHIVEIEVRFGEQHGG